MLSYYVFCDYSSTGHSGAVNNTKVGNHISQKLDTQAHISSETHVNFGPIRSCKSNDEDDEGDQEKDKANLDDDVASHCVR